MSILIKHTAPNDKYVLRIFKSILTELLFVVMV